MSPLKKPQTKVVDSLKTQLEALLEALNHLYDTINSEMNRIGSDFDEINEILAEGFRNVLDGKAPIDVVESASSSSEDEGDSDASEGSSEETDTEQEAANRKENASALVKMVQSWGCADS